MTFRSGHIHKLALRNIVLKDQNDISAILTVFSFFWNINIQQQGISGRFDILYTAAISIVSTALTPKECHTNSHGWEPSIYFAQEIFKATDLALYFSFWLLLTWRMCVCLQLDQLELLESCIVLLCFVSILLALLFAQLVKMHTVLLYASISYTSSFTPWLNIFC